MNTGNTTIVTDFQEDCDNVIITENVDYFSNRFFALLFSHSECPGAGWHPVTSEPQCSVTEMSMAVAAKVELDLAACLLAHISI